MLRGVFVTGTDTGVGKTVVSAALVMRYRRIGPVRYWKPIQTGIEEDDDTQTVEALAGPCALHEGIRLPRPLSPHLAARLNGTRIDLEGLLSLASAQDAADRFVVEGAGGALVPVNESKLMSDFIEALNVPALIVARSTLGTINHTLLTIEALRRRKIPIAGVILNGPQNPENRAAIEHYGEVAVIGELLPCDPLTRDALTAQLPALDPREVLAPLFQP